MVRVLLELQRYDEALSVMAIAIKNAPVGEDKEAKEAYDDLVQQVAGIKLQVRMGAMNRADKREMA